MLFTTVRLIGVGIQQMIQLFQMGDLHLQEPGQAIGLGIVVRAKN